MTSFFFPVVGWIVAAASVVVYSPWLLWRLFKLLTNTKSEIYYFERNKAKIEHELPELENLVHLPADINNNAFVSIDDTAILLHKIKWVSVKRIGGNLGVWELTIKPEGYYERTALFTNPDTALATKDAIEKAASAALKIYPTLDVSINQD